MQKHAYSLVKSPIMIKLRTLFLPILFLTIVYTSVKCQIPNQHLVTSGPAVEQMQRKIDIVMQRERIPGLMISIVKKDRILFSGGIGYADLEQKIKATATSQFHLASITKFFVALGIQKLIAEGRLNLNDQLKSIAPEIPYTNQWESSHPVRLVHLLEHTAGFEDIQINKMVNTTGTALTGIDAIKALENSLTSRWEPGKMMSYSNPGYNVLGYIVEKVSGMPWNKYIQQTLLDPLGMDSTLFDLSGQRREDYAKGYDYRNGHYKLLPLYIPSGNGASSALVSNAADMSKLLLYLLNAKEGGNGDLLNQNDLRNMEIIRSTLASRNGLQTGYALGNDLFPNNKKITFRGHNGKGEGFVSWIFFNRGAGLAYAISANCNTNLWPISEVIEDFLTKDLEAPKLSSQNINRLKIEPLLGYYRFMNPKNERWQFYRRIFEAIKLVSIDKDKLIVNKGNGEEDTLIHEGNGIFRAKGNIIPSFIIGRDDEGQPFFQGYGGSFFSKTNYTAILIQKIPIYLGLIAALLCVVFTITGALLVLLRKVKISDLWLTLLPTLGIISFLGAYRKLGATDEINKELFTSMNGTTMSIFIGMLFFALSVVVGACLLYRRWSHINTRWVKFCLTFNIIFLLYLVVLLSIHGWIGVPIWSM